MTRRAWLFLAAVVPALAAATTPLDTRRPREVVTLDHLMESCTVIGETAQGLVPNFDCESFLYGVIDAHVAHEEENDPGAGGCTPPDLAPWQLYERIGDGIPRERWGEPAASLLLDLLEREFACAAADVEPTSPPLATGEHAMLQRYAEHPLMRGPYVVAVVDGMHIRIEDRRRSEQQPDGAVLAEGDLAWHAASRQWIIVTASTDVGASEVGGCSDGAEVVDLDAMVYWTC